MQSVPCSDRVCVWRDGFPLPALTILLSSELRGGAGTAKFNKHIRMNVCYEDVCENRFVRTLLMQSKS